MEVGYFVSLALFTTIYALFSLGLNLQWGYTGLINFGHIAFMAIGAYTTIALTLPNFIKEMPQRLMEQYPAIANQEGLASMLNFLGDVLPEQVPLVIAVLTGALLAALLGLAIGTSTLRLREDYLSIVTIGVSEVVRLVAVNEEWLTRGPRGVFNYPLPLEKLEPNLVIQGGMIASLVLVLGLALWRLWQWLLQQPQRDGRPPLSPPLFVGYVLCLVGVAACWWFSFSLSLTIELPSALQEIVLLMMRFAMVAPLGIVGVILVYASCRQPLQQLRTQSMGTHLSLLAVSMGMGLVVMFFGVHIMGIIDYTYKAGLLWLLILTIALVFWQLERWVNSPWGRVLTSIREDEEVAKALGKNVFRYKLQSFMLGGAIAGIAGSFYAWQLTFINPDGFIPLLTFQAWIIIVAGGAGNNVGTLLGAGIFWAYNEVTRFILPNILPLDDARLGAFRVMVIGLMLIVLMMWRPQGLLGKKEELTLGR
ncbi:branched-chain amino acid ABC transporter permease [Acaryochloris marina]|uniref:Branched-chain amino acid ABC transporter permease protein n=1 Tax=Acaryochloris marina (strain MBIC 11017) TaxID=329726 RepID=B0CCT8_ACAM1|nr:branched-chain amino acid ABC transporter permease [Acaryochloris marina]ABW29250.1 branched-chain amino acid ABC transporter permease protein [Acaryochloris marina MBIC11017]BDM78168.1 branched-chain amino acid ABC transporter permease [Acaryochloris marina MBIC10699]